MLIATVTPEVATDAVAGWLDRHRNDDLVVSDWTTVEIASALAIKVRAGHLSEPQRTRVQALLDTWCEETLEVLPLDRALFQDARRRIETTDAPLRSGDALHLAAAARQGATLVTLDRALVAAADAVGVRVVDPRS